MSTRANLLAERLKQIAESQRMDFDSPSVAMTLDEAAETLLFQERWYAPGQEINSWETLGDIANTLMAMKRQGVTRSDILYVVDRMFWEGD